MDETGYPQFTYSEVGGQLVATPDFEIPDPVLRNALHTLELPTTATAILNAWPKPRSKRLSGEGCMVMAEGPLGMASGQGANEVEAIAMLLIDLQRDWAVMRDRQAADAAAVTRFDQAIGLEPAPVPPSAYNLAHDHMQAACDNMVRHIEGSITPESAQRVIHVTRSRLNTILDVCYTDAVDAMKRRMEATHGERH